MNTTKKLQQTKLDQWTVLCIEQSQSSLTIRQWCTCTQNGYTIHTCNYLKHRLKESYVDSILPDIVPITPQAPAPLHELCDSRKSADSCINNTISVSLCGVTLSLDASASDCFLYNKNGSSATISVNAPSPRVSERLFGDLCYGWISGLSHSGKGEGRPDDCRLLGARTPEVRGSPCHHTGGREN